MKKPLVLIDARIPDQPLEALHRFADVVRYADDEALQALIQKRGDEVIALAPLLTTEVDEPLLKRLSRPTA